MNKLEYREELDKIKIKKNSILLVSWIIITGIMFFATSTLPYGSEDIENYVLTYMIIITIVIGILELNSHLKRTELKKKYEAK